MQERQSQEQSRLKHPPVFVVGTGRCGSTMISNMLREHQEVLSISEFFTFMTDLGSLIPAAFPVGNLSAEQFWSMLSGLYHKQNSMLHHHVEMDEVLYPFAPTSCFTRETGVPALLQTTLPHLTTEHDVLFDEVQKFVTGLSPAPIQHHYTRLFEWLMQRFGKQLWVERSGGSLRIVHRLAQLFPDAKFLHLVRDGRDCALSMSRHSGFRMVLLSFQLTEILGCDPFESADRSDIEDLPDELVPFLPEIFDAQAFRNYVLSPSLCGHYWSGEIMQGLQVLSQLPAERVRTMYYEDFLISPEVAVKEMIGFIDPAESDPAWVQRVAGLVRPTRSAWQTMTAKEQKLLEAACDPGFAALGIAAERYRQSTRR